MARRERNQRGRLLVDRGAGVRYRDPVVLLLVLLSAGCAARQQIVRKERPSEAIAETAAKESLDSIDDHTDAPDSPAVLPVAHSTDTSPKRERVNPPIHEVSLPRSRVGRRSEIDQQLAQLEALALLANPAVRRLKQEVQAAWAKAGHVDKLPDPTIGANVFGHPIETASGSQRANLTVAQMIPWLERLDARTQQACYEAMSLQETLRVEQLKVVADVRTAWYRLYVLARQIETNEANQQLLTSSIEVANARVATGGASHGDVLLATLELSRLQEQLILYRQQVEAAKADLNRAMGRDASHPVAIPETLDVSLPAWSHESLRQLASQHQPAIAAARLHTQATRWGVEVARLERRPNVALSATWFAIDDNRPATSVVNVGEDAWSFGAQVSVPLWHRKYDAIENEATWKHFASHASVEDVTRRFDAMLRDLWERARAADETRRLYRETILPQARQTLAADQQSYSNGAVEFDRVVRDLRNVLTLEDGLHRATGQLATALARIEQAVGKPIISTELPAR